MKKRYREFPRQLVAIDKGDDRDDDVEFTVGIYPTGSVEPLPSPTPAGYFREFHRRRIVYEDKEHVRC